MTRRKTTAKRGSKAALILIDVINHFEFPDGEELLKNANRIIGNLAKIKRRAREAGIPTIYVNDNFGDWRSDAKSLVAHCLRPEALGREFVEKIHPTQDDYFVLKPLHSAFYQTPFETLLRYLNVDTLILGGLATNSCVLCTAHDAKMRDFHLFVPSDCSAARSIKEHRQAIEHIVEMTDARAGLSTTLRLTQLTKPASR